MKFNILKKWFIVLPVILMVAFTSCEEEQEASDEVILEAYGPNPALRGSDIIIIGQNLDKVTSVIFPENIEVTEIEKITANQIKVTVPQTAEKGQLVLVTPAGNITSKAIMGYTEPVVISSISPNPVKAGQTLTITGDYLNLMQKVIFAEDVEVTYEQFTSWDRKTIELLVPKIAQTGVIVLSDTAEMALTLKSDTVLQVTLPSVSSMASLENKKPGDAINISGADLDLVEYVVLPNGDSVEFSLNSNALSFTLPSGTTDGTISMISYSGITVDIAQLSMAVPTSLAASPATGLRGGDEITVTGVNMDLVTTVVFPGLEDQVTPSAISATQITITMPELAISGEITLNTASGKTASLAVETQKPAVSAYDPSTVSAGNDVVITGTDLDLVTSITFSGGVTVDVTPTDATSITVNVPVDAESGELILNMANGETATATSLTIEKPVFCYIPVLPSETDTINAGDILTIEVANEDKLTDVQINGSTVQFILNETMLYIMIPENSSGSTELKLVSSNGEIDYEIDVLGGGIIVTTIFNGPLDITWSDGGRVLIPASAFTDIPAGAVMKIQFVQNENWGQAQINNGSWATIPFSELGGDGYITTDTYGDKTVTEQELVLTQDVLDNINTNAGDYGIIIQGQDWTIAKITITVTLASESVIFNGPLDITWNDGGRVLIPAAEFTGLTAGTIMKVYFTQNENWGQAQINNGSWATIPFGELNNDGYMTTDTYGDKTVTEQELVLTQDILDNINTNAGDYGIIIQGQEWTITKVSLIY